MSTKQDKETLSSILNPFLPFAECHIDEIVPEELKDEEIDVLISDKIKAIEIEAIRNAESGELGKSIDLFTDVIECDPQRPASYNNRAQAYRLQGNIEGALEDLRKTIDISGGKGRSACLAFCQRGLLYRLRKQEDSSKNDFEKAASLGSKFAAKQLVHLNSYAALCNDMLNKVLAMYRDQL